MKMEAKMVAANDNGAVTVGSGNVFLDLGFPEDEAERAILALAEFHAKGGIRYEDFKAELESAAIRKGEA